MDRILVKQMKVKGSRQRCNGLNPSTSVYKEDLGKTYHIHNGQQIGLDAALVVEVCHGLVGHQQDLHVAGLAHGPGRAPRLLELWSVR